MSLCTVWCVLPVVWGHGGQLLPEHDQLLQLLSTSDGWPAPQATKQRPVSPSVCVCARVIQKILLFYIYSIICLPTRDDRIFSSVDGVWPRPQWTHTTCQPRTGLCFPQESYRLHSTPKIIPSEQSRLNLLACLKRVSLLHCWQVC